MAETNSFPSFHTTGPVHNYIRVGGFNGATGSSTVSNTPTGEIWYLGTCETQPIAKMTPRSQAIFNDIGGRSIPVQETHDGEDADLGLMLSRFSQQAYINLQTFSNTGAGLIQTSPGAESYLSRGSLLYGTRTFELWQWFSFSGTIAATPGLPLGYYWPQVKLGQHGPEKWGSEGEVILISGKGTPRWYAPSVSSHSRWVTRSSNSADFPASVQVER